MNAAMAAMLRQLPSRGMPGRRSERPRKGQPGASERELRQESPPQGGSHVIASFTEDASHRASGRGAARRKGGCPPPRAAGVSAASGWHSSKAKKAFQHRGLISFEGSIPDAAIRATSGSRLDGRHFGSAVVRSSSRKSVRTRVLDRVGMGVGFGCVSTYFGPPAR